MKIMEISIKDLQADMQLAITDFAREFGIRIADTGAEIVCREADELTAEYNGKTLTIGTRGGKGFFRALSLSANMPKYKPFFLREQYGLRDLGLMTDCSRNAVPTLETVKKLIRYMAALGYTTLQLYTEDLFEVEGEPFFGYLRGRYSQDDLRALDDYAARFGIEMIPCVQTLAHFTAPTRWDKFNEGKHDINDILLVGEEKTYAFIEKIFAAMRACFRSKNIHIGMDEAHMLGLGKYLDKHGYCNRFDILCRHLERVAALAEKYDFTPMMWSDMFFRLAFGGKYYVNGGSVPKEVREKVPKNVKLVYWDYYSTEEEHYDDMFRAHKEFTAPTVFAGGFWKWRSFTPHNGFSLIATQAAINSAKRYAVDDAFFTMWGDNGAECPLFSVLPNIVSAAENVYGHGDDETWVRNRFKQTVGLTWENFMLLDLPDVLEGNLRDLKNPCKYLLYNDCLMGIYDCTVQAKDGKQYAQYAECLQKFAKHKKWGYMFASAAALCRVLALKANLGNRTHDAYKAGDTKALGDIAENEYGELLRLVRKFYTRFRTAWLIENKPQGFEVQDIRLGGLYGRIESCRKTLRDYLDGKTDRVAELDEPRIDLSGGKEFSHKHCEVNYWRTLFTGGVL